MPGHPIFARFYDRMLAGTEKAGLADMRRNLVAQATGRTLEIGAGTGHNLPYYGEAVTELVLAEPDPHMAKRLREQAEEEPPAVGKVSVIEAPAEDLPFDNGSFDTVVSTLVLCTVGDPVRAVAEIKRVLKDGGALLYLEHVRGQGGVTRAQDFFERPWGWLAGGCHPNRPTGETLVEAGFWIERLDRAKLPKAPPIVRPLITGVARRPDGAGAKPDY